MLRNILGIPLIVLGFGILFITGLWGCYLSWNVIHDVSSGLVGGQTFGLDLHAP